MVWGQDEEFKNKRNVPETFRPISIFSIMFTNNHCSLKWPSDFP